MSITYKRKDAFHETKAFPWPELSSSGALPCLFYDRGAFYAAAFRDSLWPRSIIREPDFLITDYFVIGGIGAAFLNAGLITLVLLFVLYLLRMEIDGHTLTSCCLIFGFSLFGKM